MTTFTSTKIRHGYAAGPAQMAALVVAVIFLLLGVLGFIPGVTKDLGSIRFAGPHSDAMIFGLFQTSVIRNALYLLIGLAGLGAPRQRAGSTMYIAGVGALMMALWLYGLLFGNSATFGGNIWPSNLNDFALDFCLGLALMILALSTSQLAMMGSDYEE